MNIFSKFKSGKLRKPSTWRFVIHRIGRDPWTDWLIVFVVSFSLATLLVIIGSLSYASVGKLLSAPPIKPETTPKSFDPALLRKTLDSFDVRASEREALSKGYIGPADPSR